MWRTLFIALGVMAMIFGLECMIIDSATIYAGRESTMLDFFDPTGTPAQMILRHVCVLCSVGDDDVGP